MTFDSKELYEYCPAERQRDREEDRRTKRAKKGRTLMTPDQKAEHDQKILDDFNAANPVGKVVWYWTVLPSGPVRETAIREPAWYMPSGEPVCMVNGVRGGVSIWHISDVDDSRRGDIKFAT